MGMVVRTNTMALNAYRQLGMNNNSVAKSLEKLSSGFRINRAGDDAAGLAISEKMKAQITGLETASSNAQDGISLIQTAEGALTEVHSMLNRMVELATKSANGTYQNEVDREAIQAEVDALNTEIDRIAKSTNFNGINLLDGTAGLNNDAFTIGASTAKQVGADIPLTTANLPAEVTNPAAATQYHLTETGVSQSAPEFVADFADFAKSYATGDNVSINIAGKAISWAAGGAISTAEDLVNDFMAVVTTGGVTGVAMNTAGDADTSGAAAGYQLNVGSLNFDIESATDEAGNTVRLKFTYSHKGQDASGNMDPAYTSTDATNFNTAVANSVAAGTGDSGLVDHAVTLIKKAEAEVKEQRAGTVFTLTSDIVADGNKLTIDDKTFVFKTNADSSVSAGSGEILIDVSGAGTASADQIKEAVLQLANTANAETPENFQIGAAGTNAIHIDQKIGSDKVYDTYEKLKNVFSAQKADTPASTALTVDKDKLTNGNSIKVGKEVFTFVSGAADASKNEIAIGDNTYADFEKALTAKGFGVTRNGGDFTISAPASQTDAPVISGAGITLQIGDTGSDFNMMKVAIDDMSTTGLGINGLKVDTADAARAAIDTIKNAINTVSTNRANMGALQNRLEHTINNLDVAVENLSAANSRIRDTDMAKEMMNYTKMNVLVQSAQAMLAQANQQPQSVLQLLQ